MVLAGCASNQALHEEITAPQKHSVGWVKQDWRICKDDACPKPTPKTVELSAPPMAVAAHPTSPDKARTTQMTTAREPVVVHFEFAKAIPVGDWKHALETIERQVTPSDSLLIKAYTDDVGSARYNDRLARQRAEFVLSWLKARGVKNPMEVEARGKCCYVEPNDTDAGRAANRRAEIHFVNTKEINR
jgi:outer membrane protein OmpA-like peptidoglycan-associated protein